MANGYRLTRVSRPDFAAGILRYGTEEMVSLLTKAADLLTAQNIWVNHDCGLNIRKWSETKSAFINMAAAGKQARKLIPVEGVSLKLFNKYSKETPVVVNCGRFLSYVQVLLKNYNT